MPVKTPRRTAARGRSPRSVERYTPRRVAEFLLANAVDPKDYARAVRAVRRMGLDPATIDHVKPTGVK